MAGVLEFGLVLGKREDPISEWNQLSGPGRVTFDVLITRLIQQVKQRIDNGEFTERGLARILGISQSQTHNVLKGARRLQMQLADRMLMKLGLSAMDLLSQSELDGALRLKMAEWDRQLATDESVLVETELHLAEFLGIKKPAVRSTLLTDAQDRKTA